MNAAMPMQIRPTPRSDDAWRSLFLRLRLVGRSVVGPGRDRDARADDLAQETIARLLRAGKTSSDFAYARKTLVRLYLDQERSMRRRLARRMAWTAGRPKANHDGDAMSDAEALVAAQQAMATLSPLQRSAFALRVIEEMRYDEIAAAMNTSAASARSSVYAARQRLSRALEEMKL